MSAGALSQGTQKSSRYGSSRDCVPREGVPPAGGWPQGTVFLQEPGESAGPSWCTGRWTQCARGIPYFRPPRVGGGRAAVPLGRPAPRTADSGWGRLGKPQGAAFCARSKPQEKACPFARWSPFHLSLGVTSGHLQESIPEKGRNPPPLSTCCRLWRPLLRRTVESVPGPFRRRVGNNRRHV